jgi:hypothetical protein
MMIEKLKNWMDENSTRPALLHAAKDILVAISQKYPLFANHPGLPRCVEVCPAYLSKHKPYSNQTSRNAWIELRKIIGWDQLSSRRKIKSSICKLGFTARKLSPGKRYGTHVILAATHWRELKELCKRLGLLQKKAAKRIVTSISIYNNNNNNLSPQTPKKGVRQNRGRVPHPKNNPEWKLLSRKDKLIQLLFYTMQKEESRSRRKTDDKTISKYEDNWGPLAAFRVFPNWNLV